MAAVCATAQTGAQFTDGEAGTVNRKVSSAGKYLVGERNSQHSWGIDGVQGFESFVKNLGTGETAWLTSFDESDYTKMGSFTDVTDEGVICGTMKDPDYTITITDMESTFTLPLNVAAVWKEGRPVSLGLGTYETSDFSSFADGTFATAISNDAKTVVGYVSQGNYATVTPCGWTLDEATGKYDFVEYAVPEGTLEARIADVSGDGSVAVGYCRGNYASGFSQACYWPSPSECVLIGGDGAAGLLLSLTGQAFAISDNGEYIAATTDGVEPVLYSVADREIRRKLGRHADASGLTIGGVTDNGDVFGTYKYYNGNTRPFWYSMDNLITTDFDYFIYLYANDIELPYKFDYWSNESLSFTGVSADGSVMAGDNSWGAPWTLTVNPHYVNIPPAVGDINATPSGLGEVTVTFNRIELEQYMNYKAEAYVIYRGGKEIGSVAIADLDKEGKNSATYIDREAADGTNTYAVAVRYTDTSTQKEMLSPKCEEKSVFVETSYVWPLYDDFSSLSITTNNWTVQRDYGNTDLQQWGCMMYFGIDGSPFMLTSVVETEPYSYSVVTPHLDARDKESVYISFARMWEYTNGSDWQLGKDTLSVEVSTDGLDWACVDDLVLGEVPCNLWSFEYFDLTPWAAGKVFQVRLRTHGQALCQYIWSIENVTVDEKPQHKGVDGLASFSTGDGKLRLTWKNTLGAYPLNYLANTYSNAFVLTVGDEGRPFIAVNKFDKADLGFYDGKYLTSITTEINKYESEDLTPVRVAVVVYEDGKQIREQEITSPKYNEYITIKLDEPVLIDASKELMFGLKLLEYGADQMPIVYHNTGKFVNGKSNLYSQDGGNTWQSLDDYYQTVPGHETDGWASWFITGNVTDEPEAKTDVWNTDQFCYEVYKNGQKYTDLFVYFHESGYTDEDASRGDTYEVRTFFRDGTVSELSSPYTYDGATGIGNVETVRSGNGWTIDNGELNVDGDVAKIELYTVDGMKVYEGSDGSVSLNGLGRGVFILKVYTADGGSASYKISC